MMTQEDMKLYLQEKIPQAVPEEGEWLQLHVEAADWPALANLLKREERWQMDYLFCLTCVDWKTHLSMVYHLTSTVWHHNLVIKIKLDPKHPVVDSVSQVWRTAEFHEREVYELFGVHFSHHPDLRLLILPDGWEGKHPLRKDFDDPVNMIRL